MYDCPNFEFEHFDVLTHQSPACAFRAPGQPQGCFALEQAVDELAEKLKMDPIHLRDIIDKNQLRKIQRQEGAKKFGWDKRKAPDSSNGSVKIGIGMAQGEWPRFIDMDSSCEVRLGRDGSVEFLSSVQDIGTGIRTALAQVVAEELGMHVDEIHVRIGDTLFPAGPMSGGSMTTGSITPAARKAAFHAKQKLLQMAAEKLHLDANTLDLKNGRVFSKEHSDKAISMKELLSKSPTEHLSFNASRAPDYGGFEQGNYLGFGRLSSVQFVELSVDTGTGRVRLNRVLAVASPGRPINPLAIESQINGGIIQGMSWALYEHRHVDKASGIIVNSNLESYKIAYAKEIPHIDIILLEEYLGRSSTDAGGIGEPAIVPTAAAIANAFYNATGVRMFEMPFTPDRVLAALSKQGVKR
jgi:xanthine dehydrogenase YagR molybdenum-binding subunit